MSIMDRLFGSERANSRITANDKVQNQSVPVTSGITGTNAPSHGVFPPDNPESLSRMADEARALTSKALAENSDHTAALKFCQQTLVAQERVLGPNHPDTIQTVGYLGGLLSLSGDYDGAQRLLLRAVSSTEQAQGPDHPNTQICLMNLAGVLVRKGDLAGAANLYSRALGSGFKLAGMKQNHPHVHACVKAYVDCLSALGYSNEKVMSMVAELGRPYGIAPLWSKGDGRVIVGR